MSESTATPPARRKYVPVVGPRLKRLLSFIFAVFAVLTVNSVYLVAITIAGPEYQNWFYLNMFWVHLVLGIVLVLPVVIFGVIHIRNSRNRPNRRAIRAGYGVFIGAMIIFASGFVLTRDMFGIDLHFGSEVVRDVAYWAHVIGPIVVIWLYILHRLAGRRIKWKVGMTWATVAGGFAVVMLIVQMQDPRAWGRKGPDTGTEYYKPALSRTATGDFIPPDVLDNNEYCLECHEDIHRGWTHSAHRLASFNNPVYEFSIKATREALMERDGNVHAARFCAGCHDPVPFLTGAFDDPRFDDPHYDLKNDPMAQAGITCTVCHAISHVNSTKGNGDYTITEPVHYPFAFSENPVLRWVNRQLIKAKPEFHKATFLKPLHKETEFCSVCHKVHIPEELNQYKWLRGQNHHDSFFLSGVSGQGVTSFYYPPKSQPNCNQCHMPLELATGPDNFAAKVRDDSGERKIMDHQFPSANTGILHLLRDQLPEADERIKAHAHFNEDVMRLDIFAVREDGRIDGALLGPIRPEVPVLEPGKTYLIESIIRTMKMGHVFTNGTTDSNEVWFEAEVRDGDRIIGRSGGLDDATLAVDPFSHFVHAYIIDRNGWRIDRRNVRDIFTAVYNNQIPPGAADVVHGKLRVPDDATGPITVTIKLHYRKFTSELMRHVVGDENYRNDLPIMLLAEDTVTFPVAGDDRPVPNESSTIPLWQRWNDYGIALLRNGQLRQAEHAFAQVESLGYPDGPLNLARVYINEGLVQTAAPDALKRAAEFDPPANPWSLLWFGAQVAIQNGDFDDAIERLEDLLRGGFAEAEGRNFDFSKDYRVHTALGNALYQQALARQGDDRRAMMERARDSFSRALEGDEELLAAHYGLKQVYRDLGDVDGEARHEALHAKYKPDDNATDYAIAQARLRYEHVDIAAEAVVIVDLQREGAYGMEPAPRTGETE